MPRVVQVQARILVGVGECPGHRALKLRVPVPRRMLGSEALGALRELGHYDTEDHRT